MKREASLKNLNICGIFSFDKVELIVNSLPDTIDIKDSELWDIDYEEEIIGNEKEKRRVGIIPKAIKKEQENKREFYRTGAVISVPKILKDYASNGDKNNDDTGKSEQKKNRYIPDVRFSDIGGIDEIIGIIREVIELPLKQSELFKYMGIRPHKGILLHGLPGCGKTLIAKAIANEINAHFILITVVLHFYKTELARAVI